MISVHAIVRWLERVEGIDLSEYRAARPDIHDGDLLKMLEQATGQPIKRVVVRTIHEEIPSLRAAIACGASRVRFGRGMCVIIRGGIVVTVQRHIAEAPHYNYFEKKARSRQIGA